MSDRPVTTSAICPRCGYDYTDQGGTFAAAYCDCRDAA